MIDVLRLKKCAHRAPGRKPFCRQQAITKGNPALSRDWPAEVNPDNNVERVGSWSGVPRQIRANQLVADHRQRGVGAAPL